MTPATAPAPLGELNVALHLDALYLLGDAVAVFNEIGVRLLPGFSADMSFNYRTGQWVLSDPEHVELNGFTPETAAAQFAEFVGEPLRAILGGYARRAYHALEPRHLGFVRGVLAQLLPGPLPLVPEPRPPLLDLGAVLQAYGSSLQAGPGPARLVFGAPAVPAARPADWQLVMVAVTFFVAGLNLTPWLLHVAACDPANEMAQLLGAMARGDLREPAWGGVLASLSGAHRRREKRLAQLARQPAPLAQLLGLLAGVYARAETPGQPYTELPVFRLLRAALAQLPRDDASALYEFTLAGILDGLDALAQQADAQGQTVASLTFAQLTQIGLQLLLERVAPPLTESWFSRVEARENAYSWRSLSPDGALDHQTVWQFANYAGSAAFAVRQHVAQLAPLFEQSTITNHLWTAVWRVLRQVRTALRLCEAVGRRSAPSSAAPEDPKSLALMLQHLLAHHQQLLKAVAAMIERSLQTEPRSTHWAPLIRSNKKTGQESPLMQELLACMAVHGTLASYGYGPEASQSLGKLIATLP
ncbi:hypothetical protein [Hymenobacter convexus]|uniref:hypothetical protein n=1 Tax=Hymenobacter sp. CA1UV-4 TaxID=3063782 RepID=UPI002712ED7D|nr:hypothetical protein [Hymenobacter sp. CA1UV-4]MDO7851351.1 hypothetical protein [Hymenobacter sp. CA1UV-4]